MKDHPKAVIHPVDAQPHIFLRDLTFPDNLGIAGPWLYLHKDSAAHIVA